MFKIEKIISNINHVRPIKSSYILNEIFSFLNMKQKLNIIIYNKQLQKEQGIDIEDYKNISGKYKIDGIFGLGREYKIKTNELIFEGEYLNGKRNGNGKEYYDNGKLKFEGEYKNGQKNGNGKEYYNSINSELKFVGEYLNGKNGMEADIIIQVKRNMKSRMGKGT